MANNKTPHVDVHVVVPTPDDVLNIDEASEAVKLGAPLLRRAISSGHLQAARIAGGGGDRIVRRHLVEWVAAGCPGIEKEK